MLDMCTDVFVANVCVSMFLLVCSMFTNNYIFFCIRLAQHQLQHITITSGMLEHCGQVGASSCNNQDYNGRQSAIFRSKVFDDCSPCSSCRQKS